MTGKAYRLLPFNFEMFDSHVLLTNDVGEYCFLPHQEFDSLVSYNLPKEGHFNDLLARGFVAAGFLAETIENLADKYRTKKRHLYDFTTLQPGLQVLPCVFRSRHLP